MAQGVVGFKGLGFAKFTPSLPYWNAPNLHKVYLLLDVDCSRARHLSTTRVLFRLISVLLLLQRLVQP